MDKWKITDPDTGKVYDSCDSLEQAEEIARSLNIIFNRNYVIVRGEP